ncbi:MAG: murein L,D-transpeptidase [Mesorhizobium sp.]|uniref:L,D-transpeptidase family protein n=1 Tax=unclassified Mesorhizobium TaxID=325217 RepID=UPI0007ED2078|nr:MULTISPECIES: L,D-transpeptidase family protein [unclassified Mesorhizobium]QIA24031.1 L,D-transpeptidase family protein [Mesorhizobium sp. AA22]RUV15850.1 murein L,D-transpeptidase [Mesorhizobium sp. M5C.F.Ca.IN.020.32.2.1]RUV75383.1 murein L,D-transpeptidase [Mesorhizobium sp. M5C.F.Cr.IN.023.01.1.1]RWC32481.1 MAG: murein L,D-transpeptidase [Mesorhizobium sp.]RWC42851.1 MAG: murein L,D-transpeptidase [Mesorhizobium sp.]
MRTSRRFFLSGASALAATMLAGGASAQDVIADILKSSGRGNWNDQFDARASQGGKVASTLPIVSLQTVAYTEQAIAQYQNIVAQGGWEPVPDTKKLQLGVVDPDVVPLRRRLMISGDLAQSAGLSEAFDSYVDAAVKRFQARHGLPSDGTLGQYTYAAMNVSAQVRLGQLQTNLQRLNERAGTLGNRYVLVDIPGAQIEAVENDRVVLRHTAVVGKIDRQTPIVDSKINEIIVNPYWNAPVSIVRKDIIPLMRKDPNYLKDSKIRLFAPDGSEVDPLTVDWSTDDAEKYRFRQDPGAGNAMASVKINFPSPDGVYMHDTPQQSLFGKMMRFDSSGCVRVQNVRDLVTWILRDTPGWNRQYFESAIKSGENIPVQVTNPVPVYFLYISAWSTGPGVVQFRDDIYGLDGANELQITSAL